MMNRRVPTSGTRLLPAAFLIMAATGAMTLTGCEERNAHQADAAPVIRPVQTLTVQPVTFSMSGSVTGTIEARAEADLGFRIAGKLIERKVDVGDRVRAGDLLARLDDQDQRNALRTAEADLAIAQAEQVQANNEEGASASFSRTATLPRCSTMRHCCPSARRMPRWWLPKLPGRRPGTGSATPNWWRTGTGS